MDQTEICQTARLVAVPGITHQQGGILRVSSEHLLPTTYIIESASALRILLEPWVVGAELANLARESSIDFLRCVYDISPEFHSSNLENITEIIPLAGALYYNIAEAFESIFGETLSTCFIGAMRHLTPSGWVTDLAYENFEALPPRATVLIGDTIATGGTIQRIIESLFNHTQDVRSVIVYAIAGGQPGAVRLKTFAEQMDVPLYLFYSNAIFGVEPNGTDMPWLHPGTIASARVKESALSAYGPDLGRRWCSVWDWGDRAKNPMRHLGQLSARCEEELAAGATGKTRATLELVRARTQTALDRFKHHLLPRV